MAESHRADFQQQLLDRYGPRGEALYLLVAGFLAIPLTGIAAYLIGQPLLFPSLSPTVFTFFRQPLTRQAAPRNAVLGHIIAAAVGLVALLAFGLYEHPSVLQEGVTLSRIFAAASSVAITEALLVLLRLPHTTAGATTLLVSLGIFTTTRELASIVVGIVLLTVVCWIINRCFGAPVPVWRPKE